jgi:signal transduction histidine kinase
MITAELAGSALPNTVAALQLSHQYKQTVAQKPPVRRCADAHNRGVLHLKTELDGSQNMVVTVQDSGTGIDPENIERMFNQFFTTKTQGMGMGLAICRSIIEAHNGRLWAEAGAHQGSLFRISLPIEYP